MVRISDFHSEDTGSIPVEGTTKLLDFAKPEFTPLAQLVERDLYTVDVKCSNHLRSTTSGYKEVWSIRSLLESGNAGSNPATLTTNLQLYFHFYLGLV